VRGAADHVLLDDRDLSAEASGVRRRGVARRASTDDHEPDSHATRVLPCLLLLVSLLVAAGLPAAPPAHAAGGSSRAQADYALDHFGDPWDFSNPEDFDVTPNVSALQVHNLSMAGGELHADVDAGGSFAFVSSHAAMALPYGRDSSLYPIAAAQYRTISFRMFSDHETAGGVFWFSCPSSLPSCQGGFSFLAKQGWNDYSFVIPNQATFAGSVPWSGTLYGLRIIPSGGSPASVAFDWLRLTPAGADTQPSAVAPPQPRNHDPHPSGGADYASVVRGDAWDFSQPGDVESSADISGAVAGGVLDGFTTTNDAYLYLPLGGAPIDGTRYHRLVFRISYDGPFSLEDAAGGGMNARVIFQVASNPAAWQDSEDIIVYPGTHTYEIELGTNPPQAATDTNTPIRIGWAGQSIVAVRFDPDEDRAARHFVLDDIRFATDDEANGSFPIHYIDDAWKPGTTVDLYADTDRNGCDGTLIEAAVPVTQGVNTYQWDTHDVGNGQRWVCGRFHDATYESPAYATGPVQVRPGPRSIASACPAGRVPDVGLVDVSATSVHGAAIECVVWWEIAHGVTPNQYAPAGTVTRGQMASFIARMIDSSGRALPDASDRFPDDSGNPHERNLNRLAAAGIVSGRADGTYGPDQPVTRAQMATFLVRAYGYSAGAALAAAPGPSAFPDVAGSPHEANINAAAQAGFLAGRADGTYGPDLSVQRDQMASFLARVLGRLVDDGAAHLPA
jgi:hypothetical protein